MLFYRKHWFDIGLGLAAVGGVLLALFWNNLSLVQIYIALNFLSLLLHNYEEYGWPGTLPGEMNVGLFKSDIPDRYPFNMTAAVVVNPIGAYIIYLLPIFFPHVVWLALGPVILGITQLPTHAIVMARKIKKLYSAGVVTSVLFSVFGFLYINQIYVDGTVTVMDWVCGFLYFAFIAAVIVQGPIHLFKRRDYPYSWSRRQLGPWATSVSEVKKL